MAEFYATIEGGRQAKTCTGTKNSGIRAAAQSWKGSVVVSMYEGLNGEIKVNVGMNDGSGCYINSSSPEFRGTLDEFKALLQLAEDVKSGKVSVVHHRGK